MNDTALHRLLILRILVLAMFAALLGRLFTVQVLGTDGWSAEAAKGRYKEVVVPATRGLLLDQAGRILVGNTSTIVVSINASVLSELDDNGDSVLAKLAPILKTTASDLRDRITVCGTEGAKRPPICWNGTFYQPVPVAKNLDLDVAVRIMERQTDFPGVRAEVQSVRTIPTVLDANIAHILGYLGPVNEDELNSTKGKDQFLQRTDLIGRAGIEAQYDEELRGTPGVKTLQVDSTMAVIGTVAETAPKPGSYVVLNIDTALQKVVEVQLQAALDRAKQQGFAGDSGAAVVMDVTNGHILAMASAPTYDPKVWLNGVTSKEYDSLTSDDANAPLMNRAIQGLYAPASTFKVITTVAAHNANVPLGNTIYPCPSSIKIGNREMHNHESNAYGNITVTRALEVSCNTVFYKIGYQMWLKDGGNTPKSHTKDAIEKAAKALGLGSKTGVDLPSESRGRVGGRAFKTSQYEQYKDLWCYRAEVGYPDVAKSDPSRAAYLKLLAKENCVDGGVFRGGDAANLAIGQGDTVVTPLQMASVYAAIANGGTVWTPQLAKAIVSADGKKIDVIKPKARKQVKLSTTLRQYLVNALEGVVTDGTGRSPFYGWPQKTVPIAAKTGSGEAGADRDPTSWFASFGPTTQPKYVVVMTVSQGGTGALTSGPSVRRIWEALLGVKGSSVNADDSVLYQAKPAANLPKIGTDGSVTRVVGTDQANETLRSRYGIGG